MRGARSRWSRPGPAAPPARPARNGYSLLEVMFVLGIAVTTMAAAVPQVLAGLDEMRAAGATRYISARLQRARMEALMRGTSVAVRFTETTHGYEFAVYIDGNGNGVLTREIASGIDRRSGGVERLPDQFNGVDFGAMPGLPPIDPGGVAAGDDPIRLGSGSLASFSSLGNSSSGTLYVRGRGQAQYAVCIFGASGKTRMVKFDRRASRWRPI